MIVVFGIRKKRKESRKEKVDHNSLSITVSGTVAARPPPSPVFNRVSQPTPRGRCLVLWVLHSENPPTHYEKPLFASAAYPPAIPDTALRGSVRRYLRTQHADQENN